MSRYIIAYIVVFVTQAQFTFAVDSDRSIFQDKEGNGVSNNQLRKGDIHLDDIPGIGMAIINNLLVFVGTISIFFILVGALVYVFGWLTDRAKTYGKNAILMAIVGALISWTAWFMVNFILDNLG